MGSSLSQRLRAMQYSCCGRGDMIKCCAWQNYNDMHLQPQPNLCAVQMQHAISCAHLLSETAFQVRAVAVMQGSVCCAPALKPSAQAAEANKEILHRTQGLPHQLAAMCLPSQVQLVKSSQPYQCMRDM